MNIINITPFYPPHLGGMEKVVEEMSANLASRGHTVNIITSDIGYTKDYIDPVGYKVERMSGMLIANLPIIWGLGIRLLRVKRSNTIFHVHIAQALTPEIVLIVAKLKRIPFVAHFHLDVAPSGKFKGLFVLYKKFVLPRTLRLADKVIVFSSVQADEVIQKYNLNPDKINIIPNGVSTRFFYEKQRVAHTKPRLLFVGRLSPQKNVQVLLEALNGVSEKFDTTIIGEGELKPVLKGMSLNLKLKNIHFIGRLDGELLLDTYKNADIFVLPSSREGMPLVLLEAMAMRLPIIASDVTGIRDIVKHNINGCLVPYGNVDLLRNALESLTSDETKYKHLSEGAYKTAKMHSWDTATSLLEQVYTSMLLSDTKGNLHA